MRVSVVAAVERGGDGPLLGGVLLDVGVEEEEGGSPDRHLPDLGGDHLAGHLDGDEDRLALGVEAAVDGHVVPVVLGIGLLLEPVRVEVLLEISLPIEEAHADEGKAHVARGLHVVAREDAEAAGVGGQGNVEPVLHREVRDHAVVLALVPGLAVLVALELLLDLLEGGEIGVVLGQLVVALLGNHAEHHRGVLVRLEPHLVVEPDEESDRLEIPGKPEVVGDLLEGGERRGNFGFYGMRDDFHVTATFGDGLPASDIPAGYRAILVDPSSGVKYKPVYSSDPS